MVCQRLGKNRCAGSRITFALIALTARDDDILFLSLFEISFPWLQAHVESNLFLSPLKYPIYGVRSVST